MKLELDKAREDGMVSLFGKMAATYPSPIMEQAKDSLADLQAKTLEIAANSKPYLPGEIVRCKDPLEFSAGMESANNHWKEVLLAAAAALREGR